MHLFKLYAENSNDEGSVCSKDPDGDHTFSTELDHTLSVEGLSHGIFIYVPLMNATELFVAQLFETLYFHANNIETVSCSPKKTLGFQKKPIYLRDYAITGKIKGTIYPIANYLSYNNITSNY